MDPQIFTTSTMPNVQVVQPAADKMLQPNVSVPSVPQVASVVQPIQSQPVTAPQQPVPTPVQPVSAPHLKEQGPVRATSEVLTVSEPADTRPEIEPEVKEAGVEHSVDTEKMQLNVEHQLAGMEHAKENVPVSTQPKGTVIIPELPNAPFSAQEAVQVIKKTKTDESRHWLAALLLAILHKTYIKQLHEKLMNKTNLANQVKS